MLTGEALDEAVASIASRLEPGGLFAASIRDYDSILENRSSYSPPYIHRTDRGQRVSFQTWEWKDDNYRLTQYMIEDEDALQTRRFVCEYRATRREELTGLLHRNGCGKVKWVFPEETGFYQPIVLAGKEAGTV